MAINDCKNEIINFVLNSTDMDNYIVATFIAGMQAKKSTSTSTLFSNAKDDDRQPQKPPENRSA